MLWISGSSNHGCWLGTYELEKQQALLRLVKPGMTVYDMGAQAGFYTLFFSRLVGPGGSVCAFEPCANEARYLLAHISMNRLMNVRAIQAAVSETSGLSGFTWDRPRTENSLCAKPNSSLLVPTLSLDESPLPAPDVIKMDVEGGEAAVLRGAKRMLNDHRPVVFVALHGDEQKLACTALLRQAGYRIYSLDGRSVSGHPQSDEIYALPEEQSGPARIPSSHRSE
jgi:FkbM family methyltransferase